MNSKIKYPLDLALTKIRARFLTKTISVKPVTFGKFIWEFDNNSMTQVKVGFKSGPRQIAVYNDKDFITGVNEAIKKINVSFDGKILKIEESK